jgi:hypothetical protein
VQRSRWFLALRVLCETRAPSALKRFFCGFAAKHGALHGGDRLSGAGAEHREAEDAIAARVGGALLFVAGILIGNS